MTTSSKPTIVLVPGSFLSSSHYTLTLQPLIDAGRKVHILDPPCYHTKKPAPLPTMQDDASFIASFVEELADAGEEIVLVSHSYGGMPASECMAGLSASERRAQGKSGGVVRLAYITAVVPKVGKALGETMVGGVQVPLEVDEDGWLFQSDPAATSAVCLNTTPPAQAGIVIKALGQHSSAAFASALSYAGYAHVPASWFLCEEDRCVVPAVQEAAIADIEASWSGTEREGTKVDIKRVACDHFPTVSAQDELRAWVGGLAG